MHWNAKEGSRLFRVLGIAKAKVWTVVRSAQRTPKWDSRAKR